MKMKIMAGLGLTSVLIIQGCSQIPKECEESWNSIEKLSKESGVPQTVIDQQRIEFKKQIQSLNKDDAIKYCQAQNSIFSQKP